MSKEAAFKEQINKGYTFKGTAIRLGVAMLDGTVVEGAFVEAPLKTMNRHGLISGATGTGKTKTLQVLAEQLSDHSIPVVLMDIKGDLSGIAAAGAINDKIAERYEHIGVDYKPAAYPVELLSLSNDYGAQMRATVEDFGPVLLGKILSLNDTQGSILSMLFKYAKDNKLPLIALRDLQRLLQYVSNEGKSEMTGAYGSIASSSVGTIMRKVIELQQQGGDSFFGEPVFDINDLMRIAPDGRGIISVIRVTDMQDRPKLFSTFMLQLLSKLYNTMPEAGDLDQPKLVLFIDEAHLVFSEANAALLQMLETIIKLIRSKGVGIYFCTQNPMDVAPAVLGQLGLKIQHALRAFTANDRRDIKLTAANYPESAYYKTEDVITQLGIGEALITLLNEKGIPTPLAATLLCSPQSRMDILTQQEIDSLINKSYLVSKYRNPVLREGAFDIINKKVDDAASVGNTINTGTTDTNGRRTAAPKEEPSVLETLSKNTVVKSWVRNIGNMLIRSVFKHLGKK